MTDELLSIKGVPEGLLVGLNPHEEWQVVLNALSSRLDAQSAFFSGAHLIMNVGERPVPKYDLASLKALVERRGLTLLAIQSESQTTLDSADALDIRISGAKPVATQSEEGFDSEETGVLGVMVKRTLRSGRTVHSQGHVVIFGDVNPGAQIIASGDVIVWGRLRGTVHAGADGDTSAVVCALDMNPNQLRIANYIVTSPPDKRRKIVPEVALIRENQIVVEAWGLEKGA